jgi:hypothetical protein
MVSNVCSASLTSAVVALARWKPRGSPLPSMTSIHLVPLAHLGETYFVTAALGRCERAVEEGHRPVELAAPVERREGGPPDALPHALVSPVCKSPPHDGRRAVRTWQVLPATAGDEDVEDTVDGATVVGARSSGACGRWEERLDEGPLPVGEMNPAHAGMLSHLASVSEPPRCSDESINCLHRVSALLGEFLEAMQITLGNRGILARIGACGTCAEVGDVRGMTTCESTRGSNP